MAAAVSPVDPQFPFADGHFPLSSTFLAYNRGYNVGVGGAVVRNGKLLMVRRASSYGRGNWQIPGGFIERDETLEQAVVREVEEEAGVKSSVHGVLGLRSRTDDYNSTYVVFLLDYESGEPTPDGVETDRARWIGLGDLAGLDKLPPINARVAQLALATDPPVLLPAEMRGPDGTPYQLFAGLD